MQGGVSALYRALRGYLPEEALYFTVGARGGEVGLRLIPRSLGDCLRFLRTVAGGGWDLVHLNPSFGWKALVRDGVLLLMAKCFRIPVAVQLHGWDWNCARAVRQRFGTLFAFTYGMADVFVVLAEEFRVALKEMGIRKPVFVEAVSVEADIDHSAAVERSGGHGTEARVLFLSRMERGKGIYETLEAFGTLRQRYPGLTLSVAGDGIELPRARRYVEERGIPGVRFLGEVQGKRKQQAFLEADVFVLPSHSEGMPIALLEAMAQGLPVVTTPVGGIRDFFREGEMGFLSKVGDAASLAGALERLVGDATLRAEIGARNREYATQRFTPRMTAKRLVRIYQAVAAREHPIRESSWLDAHSTPHRGATESDEAAAVGTAGRVGLS